MSSIHPARIVTQTLLMLVFATACKSPEERLFERRQQAEELLDSLYRSYGGGALAKAVDDHAKTAELVGAGDLTEMVGTAAREMDRASFEADCLALGRGERPVFFTARGREFFGQEKVRKKCRKYAVARDAIRRLERETHADD